MKIDKAIVNIPELINYQQMPCIVFTKQGQIVVQNNLAILPSYVELFSLAKLAVRAAYFDGELLYLISEQAPDEQQLAALGYQCKSIRTLLMLVQQEIQHHVLRAYHWFHWHVQSKFCCKCGAELKAELAIPEKNCIQCEHIMFPRLSPAVMILIRRDREILLARSAHFMPGVYSALAGFVELGESCEQTIHREVMEEVGLRVHNLQYFSSQVWPFPDSFMLAFTADYLSGEITLADEEIEDAQWFSKDNLPKLPSEFSISRRLIDHVLAKLQED